MTTTNHDRREKLFKNKRPLVRPFNIYDGDKYHKDMGIAWVAYSQEPFKFFPKGLDQQGFAKVIEAYAKECELLFVEDVNRGYKNVGPLALVRMYSDGWTIEPHAHFFPFSTPRNRLRMAVAFFQWARRQHSVGACVVKTTQPSTPLFDKCIEYGVLRKVGVVPNGDPEGDEYIYAVRGKRHGKKGNRTRPDR